MFCHEVKRATNCQRATSRLVRTWWNKTRQRGLMVAVEEEAAASHSARAAIRTPPLCCCACCMSTFTSREYPRKSQTTWKHSYATKMPTSTRSSKKRNHDDISQDDGPALSFHGALKSFAYAHDGQEDHERPDLTRGDVKINSPNKDRRIQSSIASTPEARRKQRGASASARKYAHLPLLSDVLAPDLLVMFIGLNPGVTTAESGHAYAHPSNLFWKLLYSSGITGRRCAPDEDVNMPELYRLGFTNIVSRPTKDQSELTKAEMVEGAPALEEKAKRWRPEACCLVGKGIWEAVFKSRHGRYPSKADFHYGWQSEDENMGRCADWAGARLFVAASTSGASASLRPPEKEAIWRPLGEFVESRRAARAEETRTEI